MNYQKIPNTSIEVPSWLDGSALGQKFSPEKRKRNQYLIRKLKQKFFGGAR